MGVGIFRWFLIDKFQTFLYSNTTMNTNLNPDVDSHIDCFINEWNKKNVVHTTNNFLNLPVTNLTRENGRKYVKLVHGTSVYAFVDGSAGDIYKPASWKAPAKGIRGSVLSDDFGMSCAGPYGVVYMKGMNIGW